MIALKCPYLFAAILAGDTAEIRILPLSPASCPSLQDRHRIRIDKEPGGMQKVTRKKAEKYRRNNLTARGREYLSALLIFFDLTL